MKAVIFAGGLGSRLSEETILRPKPMVEPGNWDANIGSVRDPRQSMARASTCRKKTCPCGR
jgi:hypothetical protein